MLAEVEHRSCPWFGNLCDQIPEQGIGNPHLGAIEIDVCPGTYISTGLDKEYGWKRLQYSTSGHHRMAKCNIGHSFHGVGSWGDLNTKRDWASGTRHGHTDNDRPVTDQGVADPNLGIIQSDDGTGTGNAIGDDMIFERRGKNMQAVGHPVLTMGEGVDGDDSISPCRLIGAEYQHSAGSIQTVEINGIV